MSFGVIERDDHSTEVDRDRRKPGAWHAACTCGWTYDGPNYWVAGNAARAHADEVLGLIGQGSEAT